MKLSAKKVCEYENGCPYLAIYNCHVCSTFHCDRHVSLHFDESHKMDLHKHELSWCLFAAFGKDLGIPCIYNSEGQCDLLAFELCIICNVAFCCDHSHGHECIGTHRSHTNPVKYAEFQCQHCKITFKEYDGSSRYADFTHTLDWFESRRNIREKLKKKQKIVPTCLPCERRADKEFERIPEYVPVILPRLHYDCDDDEATDAHNENLQRTALAVIDHDEGANAADNGDDDAAAMSDDNHIQDDKGAGEIAPDNQKYDDQGTKDADGECNDDAAGDNQKLDAQVNDRVDNHMNRCV